MKWIKLFSTKHRIWNMHLKTSLQFGNIKDKIYPLPDMTSEHGHEHGFTWINSTSSFHPGFHPRSITFQRIHTLLTSDWTRHKYIYKCFSKDISFILGHTSYLPLEMGILVLCWRVQLGRSPQCQRWRGA